MQVRDADFLNILLDITVREAGLKAPGSEVLPSPTFVSEGVAMMCNFFAPLKFQLPLNPVKRIGGHLHLEEMRQSSLTNEVI